MSGSALGPFMLAILAMILMGPRRVKFVFKRFFKAFYAVCSAIWKMVRMIWRTGRDTVIRLFWIGLLYQAAKRGYLIRSAARTTEPTVPPLAEGCQVPTYRRG
ncbi:MAG: hypothetical protein ACYDHY_15270 [Acidiferrobacterales bacterium]